MSQGPRYPREAALAVARELVAILRPACERLKVVGSLRRLKADVGDLELLFVPRRENRPDPNTLFGDLVAVDLAEAVMGDWLRCGVLRKRVDEDGRRTWGPSNKLAVHAASGIPVDLFTAGEANWWSLVVCRTGSAASNTRICLAAEQRGWKWNPYGAGFYDRITGELIRPVRGEADVFEAVGLICRPPAERN